MKKVLRVVATAALSLMLMFTLAACGEKGVYKPESFSIGASEESTTWSLSEEPTDTDAKFIYELIGKNEIEVTADEIIMRADSKETGRIKYKLDGKRVILLNNDGNEISTSDSEAKAFGVIEFSGKNLIMKVEFEMLFVKISATITYKKI